MCLLSDSPRRRLRRIEEILWEDAIVYVRNAASKGRQALNAALRFARTSPPDDLISRAV